MESFGGTSRKPAHLISNRHWVLNLQPGPHRARGASQNTRKYVDQHGRRRCTGTKWLKSTQCSPQLSSWGTGWARWLLVRSVTHAPCAWCATACFAAEVVSSPVWRGHCAACRGAPEACRGADGGNHEPLGVPRDVPVSVLNGRGLVGRRRAG